MQAIKRFERTKTMKPIEKFTLIFWPIALPIFLIVYLWLGIGAYILKFHDWLLDKTTNI